MNYSLSHSFSVELATQYGIEVAILINHFLFWIKQNASTGKNLIEGKTWMFQTQKDIAAIYPYWSEDTVQRNIKKLIDLGIIIKGNHNKCPYDRTVWYAFQNEEIFNIPQNRGINSVKSQNQNREVASPIPDTNQDTKEDVVKTMDRKQKTMAFVKDFGKTMDIAKRWKLDERQVDAFNWLKSMNIPSEDKKLTFWAKTYSLERLQNVYYEALANKADHLGKYMNSLLENKSEVPNGFMKQNQEFAEDYKKSSGWNALQILKKYVKFPFGSDYGELSFNLDPASFAQILMQKHESCARY